MLLLTFSHLYLLAMPIICSLLLFLQPLKLSGLLNHSEGVPMKFTGTTLDACTFPAKPSTFLRSLLRSYWYNAGMQLEV